MKKFPADVHEIYAWIPVHSQTGQIDIMMIEIGTPTSPPRLGTLRAHWEWRRFVFQEVRDEKE